MNDNDQDIIDITIDALDDEKNVSEYDRTIHDITKGFAELIWKVVLPNIPDYIQNLVETVQNIVKYTVLDDSYIKDVVRNLRNGFLNIIQNISVPEIQDEKKQELIDSYTKWGKLGWTINPCSSFESVFDTVPEGAKEADKLALRTCRNMDAIFNYIREEKRVKLSDFEEAVKNYEDKRNKSCALLLFSLIDGKLIRFSGRSKEGKRRPYGNKAIGVIEKKLRIDYKKETLFLALFCVNVFACIEKMFESGDDFRKQPDVVNRHFLCHGMITKRVSRKDCIQLFLLYYNILELSNIIYDK